MKTQTWKSQEAATSLPSFQREGNFTSGSEAFFSEKSQRFINSRARMGTS